MKLQADGYIEGKLRPLLCEGLFSVVSLWGVEVKYAVVNYYLLIMELSRYSKIFSTGWNESQKIESYEFIGSSSKKTSNKYMKIITEYAYNFLKIRMRAV